MISNVYFASGYVFCYSPILTMAFYHQILLQFLKANKNNAESTVRHSVDIETIQSIGILGRALDLGVHCSVTPIWNLR